MDFSNGRRKVYSSMKELRELISKFYFDLKNAAEKLKSGRIPLLNQYYSTSPKCSCFSPNYQRRCKTESKIRNSLLCVKPFRSDFGSEYYSHESERCCKRIRDIKGILWETFISPNFETFCKIKWFISIYQKWPIIPFSNS